MKTKTQTPAAEAATPAVKSQSATLAKYRASYQAYAHKPGSLSLDNGDDVALLLRKATLEAILRAADKAAGETDGFHAARYAQRNVGSKRMNSGNVIRGALKRGDVTLKEIKAALK